MHQKPPCPGKALDLITAMNEGKFVANTSQNLHCMPVNPEHAPLMTLTSATYSFFRTSATPSLVGTCDLYILSVCQGLVEPLCARAGNAIWWARKS